MFTDFALNERLIMALEKQRIQHPTPVQAQVIPLALKAKDLLVTAETGSGKTAAFLLPVLHRLMGNSAPDTATRALVLTPTRELARQVLAHCRKLMEFTRLRAEVITGGADSRYQRALLRKNPEILIATPGRLLEHIASGAADLSDLEFLVLDEADRMLDMGFSEDVLKVAAACSSQRQTMLLSATLKHRGIRSVADRVLSNPEVITVNTVREQHSSITQQVILADGIEHKQKLLVKLLQDSDFGKALVFTNTIVQANSLSGVLRYHQLRAGVLHGDMSQDERNEVMNQMRRGHLDVLVATDVAARGLDIQGVGLVVNFEMARSGDDYVHRIGRTGRAGEQGVAIALISANEWNLMSSIERYLRIRFERRKIAGLEAKYKGPKKLKASGKAAGSKKKKLAKKEAAKGKVRHRDKKNIGKRRAPAPKRVHDSTQEEGFTPLRKKKT